MICENDEHEEFLNKNIFAVLTALRANGSPVSSVVMFARDGDRLIVSTPGKTFKRKLLEKNPSANLCVIDKSDPPNFVSVECEFTVETENVLEFTDPLFEKMERFGYPVPDNKEEFVEKQRRVLLRADAKAVYGVTRFK